jgi:hypothetical protein
MYTLNVRAAIVDDSANGRMTPTTEVGIAIALSMCLSIQLCFSCSPLTKSGVASAVCFLTLLLGFYIVSRSRPASPSQHTPEAEQIALSYGRWEKNMSGRGKSARQEQRLRHGNTHEQTSEYDLPLRPASTLSGSTVVDEHQSSIEYTNLPSPPAPAYFSHSRAETLGTIEVLS